MKIIDSLSYIDTYLSNMKYQNSSKNTLETYSYALNNYTEYVESVKSGDINKLFLMNFIRFLASKGYSSNSIEVKLNIVKSFLMFIEDMTDEDFTKAIRSTKFKNKNINQNKTHFDENELKLILNEIEEYEVSGDLEKTRMALIFRLMYNLGLRVSEAVNLKYKNIVKKDDYYEISIIGKGGRATKVKAPIQVLEFLLSQLDWLDDKKDSFIFRNKNEKVLSRTTVYRNLTAMYKKLGLAGTGCHILRHSTASNLLNSGTDVAVVQQVLRHRNIQTTMIYAKVEDKTVKQAYEKLLDIEKK